MTKKRYYFSATHAVAAGNPHQYVLYCAGENAVPVCIGLTGDEPNPVFVETEQTKIELGKHSIALLDAVKIGQENQTTLIPLGGFTENLTAMLEGNSTVAGAINQKHQAENDGFIATAILEEGSDAEKEYLAKFPDTEIVDKAFSENHLQRVLTRSNLSEYSTNLPHQEAESKKQTGKIKSASNVSADIEKRINWAYTQRLRHETDGDRYPRASLTHGMAIKDKFSRNIKTIIKNPTDQEYCDTIEEINKILAQVFSPEPLGLPKDLYSALSSLRSGLGKWNKNAAKVKPSQAHKPT